MKFSPTQDWMRDNVSKINLIMSLAKLVFAIIEVMRSVKGLLNII